MTIGIIGAGGQGSNLARALARAGIEASISNRRGPESLAALVEELGPAIKAATVEEAAKADIVVISVLWKDLENLLKGLPDWEGRIVVDGTNALAILDPNSADAKDPSNPLASRGLKAIDLGGRHSSAVFRELVPGARVVKAFNHLPVHMLTEPNISGGQRVLFYSGDDADAKRRIHALIDRMGFFPVDLGALDVGGPLASAPFGALASKSFIKI